MPSGIPSSVAVDGGGALIHHLCGVKTSVGKKDQSRQLKSVALHGLYPSRENWLESWLGKRRLWGLEAFSLQFENLYCVKLFHTYYSIDFKVDNHH